ncbi:hypothetical protein VSQ48_06975 [Candidatus Ventrimonas sp. KK005]
MSVAKRKREVQVNFRVSLEELAQNLSVHKESRPAMQGGFEHFLSALHPTPV